MVTGSVPQYARVTRCVHCSCEMEVGARFCGDCGIGVAVSTMTKPGASSPPSPQPSPLSDANKTVPQFAHLSGGKKKRRINPELSAELGGLLTLLLRERIFLVIHCIIFLLVNLFGFSLSIECYTGYIGDEATKIVMAMTPLMFINTIGLACMSPIRGTKKEIARIKEKIQYVRFRMDFEGWV